MLFVRSSYIYIYIMGVRWTSLSCIYLYIYIYAISIAPKRRIKALCPPSAASSSFASQLGCNEFIPESQPNSLCPFGAFGHPPSQTHVLPRTWAPNIPPGPAPPSLVLGPDRPLDRWAPELPRQLVCKLAFVALFGPGGAVRRGCRLRTFFRCGFVPLG